MNHIRRLVDEFRGKYPHFLSGELKERPQPPRSVTEHEVREDVINRWTSRSPMYSDIVRGVRIEVSEEKLRRLEEEAMRGIEETGVEAIAWYAPFHIYKIWGIYIDPYKLLGLSSSICRNIYGGTCRNLKLTVSYYLCCRIVIEHEYFHFLTEYVATMLETITQDPKYLPYVQRYSTKPPGYSLEEEAAATALEYDYTQRIKNIKNIDTWLNELIPLRRILIPIGLTLVDPDRFVDKYLKHFSSLPAGYGDYHRYLINDRLNIFKIIEFWSEEFNQSTDSTIMLPTPYEIPGKVLLPHIPMYVYPNFIELRDPFCSNFIILVH